MALIEPAHNTQQNKQNKKVDTDKTGACTCTHKEAPALGGGQRGGGGEGFIRRHYD